MKGDETNENQSRENQHQEGAEENEHHRLGRSLRCKSGENECHSYNPICSEDETPFMVSNEFVKRIE